MCEEQRASDWMWDAAVDSIFTNASAKLDTSDIWDSNEHTEKLRVYGLFSRRKLEEDSTKMNSMNLDTYIHLFCINGQWRKNYFFVISLSLSARKKYKFRNSSSRTEYICFGGNK